MEARYLLDTNICIYIRQARSRAVLRHFENLQLGEAAISAIAYGELLYGAGKSSQRVEALERLGELIQYMPCAASTDRCSGNIRARLEARGQMIGNNDSGLPRTQWQRTSP